MYNNLDAEIIYVDVLAFDKDNFITKFQEKVHDHGAACPDNESRMHKELQDKLNSTYPYLTKIVYDERIGTPMLVKAIR